MSEEIITRERIDELLAFLPLFDVPKREYVREWAGGGETDDGAVTLPHPVYTDDVLRFFRLTGQACWRDYGYEPKEARAMLADDALIERATLGQIKSMITYCVRGERFHDGHWEAVLRSGRIMAILRRLAVLKESLADSV